MQCQLCLGEMGSGAPREMAGVTICASCNSDAFAPTSVTNRGMHLGFWSRSKDGSVSSNLNEMAQETEFTITALVEIPGSSGIFAKLQ
ncbi:MAG: hypothetical protein JXR76_04285 [Deltaproteobacteria bacterium]|nr:hypothetical protein [Deltaproteobacteria bacterium]